MIAAVVKTAFNMLKSERLDSQKLSKCNSECVPSRSKNIDKHIEECSSSGKSIERRGNNKEGQNYYHHNNDNCNNSMNMMTMNSSSPDGSPTRRSSNSKKSKSIHHNIPASILSAPQSSRVSELHSTNCHILSSSHDQNGLSSISVDSGGLSTGEDNSVIFENAVLQQQISASTSRSLCIPQVKNILISEIEIRNLKELVLLHIKLVQQQQEIIEQKDKVISDLRNENITLRTRLERMDRRLTIGKTPPQTTEQTLSIKKVNKRSMEAEPLSEDVQLQTKKVKSSPIRSLSDSSKHIKQDSKINVMAGATLCPEKKKSKSTKNRTLVHDGLLRLTEEFHTQQVLEFQELEEKTIPSSQDVHHVEEGTEDLEDESFLKRHQKFENDEKRRKRWDMQRMREIQMVEKLKQNQPASKQLHQVTNKNVTNIYPKAEDAQFIEICESLPVNAFGYPIPHCDASEFSLPWFKPQKSADVIAYKRQRKR